LSEEELIELIATGRIRERAEKPTNSTVFDPHIHFHVLMPNFLYWKPEEVFIRVDYYYNNQIIRSYWKSNVLRIIKKYRKYLDAFNSELSDLMFSKQYVAGTDKAWLFVSDNYEDIYHFIKYSHRPPVLDVIRYFEVYNSKADFEKIISSYSVEWLKYVITYINRTFPYGVFSNPRRCGIELDNIKSGDLEELSSKIEMKEPSHDESGAVVYESVPFFKVAKEVLANVDEILVIDKFGNIERYWEYKK